MPVDQFQTDDGPPGQPVPDADVLLKGVPQVKEDDRFTFQIMAQYLEWNAPTTTIQFGISRLVDETCSPATRTVHIEPGASFDATPFFALLDGRPCDFFALNRTGWKHHAPPSLIQRRKMYADKVGVEIWVDGVRVGTMRPGMPCIIPQAANVVLKAVGNEKASVTIYAFPY